MLDRTDPQVQWLEDYGPMNEHECWGKMRPYLSNFGIPTRLENAAATSVPDVLFICGGLMIFIELKIDYNGYFYMPPYQFGYANRIKNHLRPHFHWIAVHTEEYMIDHTIINSSGFMMFAFQRVLTMPQDTRGHKVRFRWLETWNKMKTRFFLQGEEDYKTWIDAIMKLEFEA